MNRRRIVCITVLSILGSTSAIHAQERSDVSRFSVAIATGASVGHQTSGFVSGEGAIRVLRGVAIFVEGGMIGNAATDDLDVRATTIARAVGTTASAAYRVRYADAGVRVSVPFVRIVEPYLAGGVGVARVRTETTFSSDGGTVDPGTRGIRLGPDLDGSITKPIVTAGIGVTLPVARRAFGDLGVRFARILEQAEEISNDQAIDVLRLQVGVGFRF